MSIYDDLPPHLKDFAHLLKAQSDSATVRTRIKQRVHDVADRLLAVMFPQLCDERPHTVADVGRTLHGIERDLLQALMRLDGFSPAFALWGFFHALPGIHARLLQDAEAIYAGDPAATSVDEVILAYPGFRAIALHRLAHALHGYGVPLVPRLISEYAHQSTGIDIHPGATIGAHFSIDHGTGVVIGESATVGDHVKIYQGVTLGALSVTKGLARSKRHPTIEDNVVIYAQAVILGGDTIVGHDSVVGGNAWLTVSVPPYSLVHNDARVNVRPRNASLGFDAPGMSTD